MMGERLKSLLFSSHLWFVNLYRCIKDNNSDINSKSIYCIITIHKLRYEQRRIYPQEGERACNVVYSKIQNAPKTVTTTNWKGSLSNKAYLYIYTY